MKTIASQNLEVNTAMRQYNEKMDQFIRENKK